MVKGGRYGGKSRGWTSDLPFSHPLHIHTLTHICPYTLTQAWEEKHVTVALGPDDFAWFSVVGGRDQPQHYHGKPEWICRWTPKVVAAVP